MITIPVRYKDVKYDDVPKNIQDFISKTKESRRGIYIYGECGTGKTHIAYAIVKHLQEEIKFNVKLFNIPALIRHLKEDFNDNNKSLLEENTNFGQLLNFAGLLILDDFGTEKLTEWVEESIYSIINERYERMLPIIFTSNLEPSKLVEKYGDRIVSRIIGSCDIVELTGKDKRIAK